MRGILLVLRAKRAMVGSRTGRRVSRASRARQPRVRPIRSGRFPAHAGPLPPRRRTRARDMPWRLVRAQRIREGRPSREYAGGGRRLRSPLRRPPGRDIAWMRIRRRSSRRWSHPRRVQCWCEYPARNSGSTRRTRRSVRIPGISAARTACHAARTAAGDAPRAAWDALGGPGKRPPELSTATVEHQADARSGFDTCRGSPWTEVRNRGRPCDSVEERGGSAPHPL